MYHQRHLYFNVVQLAVQFLEFEKLADEEVAVAMRHFSVGDVDHVVVDKEVQLEE